MLNLLFSILAPHQCYLCKTTGNMLCEACRLSEIVTPVSTCYRCNKLTDNFKTCARCRSHAGIYAMVRCSEYSGPVKKLVLDSKMASSRQGSDDLGFMIADATSKAAIAFDVVCYVPTVNKRVRSRGFDHSRKMAIMAALELQKPLLPLLARLGTKRQVGATRIQRKQQVNGIFRFQSNYTVSGKTVLLVDDVVSTGATIEEASRTLRKAGAKRVIAAVAAYNA